MTDQTGRPDPQLPIDLAREADFGLGASRVSPSTREVVRGAERELLEPRVMQVLVALFQAGGRVVSRDELIVRCWEGRIVGEDAINRAIGRLRRLSEADNEASFTIETIPRVGYRLLAGPDAPSQPLANDTAPIAGHASPPQTAAAVTPPQNLVLRHRLALAAVVILIAAGIAAWLLWPERLWTVESSRPFISTLALEDEPAFSPDGAMLAYTSAPEGAPRQIYVRNLAGGEGLRITNDAFDDISPSWSSDGAHIAYMATKPGEPCRIMIAAVPAGEAREAGRCLGSSIGSLSWQPNSPFVYYVEYAGLKGGAIIRLNLDTGARQAIVQEPALRDTISELHVSPDGKWLAYTLRGQHIMLHDLSAGRERQLGTAPRGNTNFAWPADSRALLVSSSNDVGGSLITAYPLNGNPPYQVYATAMRIGHLAIHDNLLALETDTTRSALARAVTAPASQPDIIDHAGGHTWSPSFAPDGTLAFLSNRSGTNAIWVLKPGATAPSMLLDGGLRSLFTMRFSPDGTRLAVVSETTDSATIKIMTAAGATLTSFEMPSLGLGLPSWTPDGKAVILFDRHCLCAYRISVDNPAQRSVFAAPHWVGIAVRAGGVFATRADKDGIWRIDGGTKQISAAYPRYYSPPMAFRGENVLVPDYGASPPRLLEQPLSGGPAKLAAYAPGAQNGRDGQSQYAVNPRTGEIIYVATVVHDTDIDLLTLAKR